MKMISVFLAVVLMVSLASIALARGAPTKDKAFTTATISVDAVTPTVALRNVPPMTVGFDVIQNLTAYPRLASVNQDTDTSARGSRSTTVAERNLQSAATDCLARSGPSPELVLLA